SLGGAQVQRRVGPGATAKGADFATLDHVRRSIRWRLIVVAFIAVLHPFPNIAVHIVEAESIGLFLANGMWLAAGVRVAPGIFAERRYIVSERIACRGSRPCRVLPFGLGQQPIGLAGDSRKPRNIADGVVPTDINHRLPTAPPAAGTYVRVAVAMSCAGVPLIESQFELADSKGVGDRDLVDRAFITDAAHFIRWRSHHKFTRRHDDHLGAVHALLEYFFRPERTLTIGGEHVTAHVDEPIGTLPQLELVAPSAQHRDHRGSEHADERLNTASPPLHCLAA